MTQIPAPTIEEQDVYSFGFDKNLNRLVSDTSTPTVYDAHVATVPQSISTGTFFNLQSQNFTQMGTSGWKLSEDGKLTIGNIVFNKQFVYATFESLDGWIGTGSGTRTAAVGGGQLQCLSNAAKLNAQVVAVEGVQYRTKNPVFQCQARFSDATSQTAYIGVGDMASGDATDQGFGFKVLGGTLYAIHKTYNGVSSTENTTELSGVTITDANRYEARYISNSAVEFYVNGQLKVKHTNNLFDSNSDQDRQILSFYLQADAEQRNLLIRYASYIQDF